MKALDAKLTEAFESHDFEMLGKHTADDYILIDPRGRVHTKEKYLEHLSKSKANPKLAELKETDVKVRVFGDTAVVAGLLHVKAKVQDKEHQRLSTAGPASTTRTATRGSASSSSTPMFFPRRRQSNEEDRPWRKPSGRKG